MKGKGVDKNVDVCEYQNVFLVMFPELCWGGCGCGNMPTEVGCAETCKVENITLL
jgi:hypothetical protein